MVSTIPAGPSFDPRSPSFLADPYPVYAYLREFAPVVRVEALHSWVVSRYADVAACLRDPRLGMNPGNSPAFRAVQTRDAVLDRLSKLFEHMMIFRDPPQHTRLRGLVNKAFTPRVVESLRPAMQNLVDGLLDDAVRVGHLDVIRDLAFPLPVTVIALMLGVPAADHERFKAWSGPLAFTIEPVLPAEALHAAGQAAGEIIEYFRDLVKRKRTDPGDDLLSAMIHAEEQGSRLTLDELLSNAVLLLVAGHETTVNLIGNGVLALMRHPEQLAWLAEDPSRIESAVEELLRYDSPAQLSTRVVRESLTLGGQAIPRDQEVLMLIGSANRDATRFTEPDRLDLARTDNRHLAFGGGPHYCLGAPLARVEGQIAIGSLVRRFAGLEMMNDNPPRRPSAVLRGLQSLPIRWHEVVNRP